MAFITFTKTKRALTVSVKIPLPHKSSGGGIAFFQERNGEVCVLLGRRLHSPFAKRWSFPGGGRELSESLLQTGLREFREETGCTILGRYISRIGKLSINRPFFKWQTTLIESSQKLNIVRSPWTKTFGGEFSEVLWVPVSSIKSYKLHPFVKEAVEAYLEPGIMKKYTPRKKSKTSSRNYKCTKPAFDKRTVRPAKIRVEEDPSMRLVKVDKDGTKYYEPVFKTVARKGS